MLGWTPFSYPFNLTQQPACSMPCGLTPAGLPMGLQLVGPMFGDALVLRAARAYEQVNPIPAAPVGVGMNRWTLSAFCLARQPVAVGAAAHTVWAAACGWMHAKLFKTNKAVAQLNIAGAAPVFIAYGAPAAWLLKHHPYGEMDAMAVGCCVFARDAAALAAPSSMSWCMWSKRCTGARFSLGLHAVQRVGWARGRQRLCRQLF